MMSAGRVGWVGVGREGGAWPSLSTNRHQPLHLDTVLGGRPWPLPLSSLVVSYPYYLLIGLIIYCTCICPPRISIERPAVTPPPQIRLFQPLRNTHFHGQRCVNFIYMSVTTVSNLFRLTLEL